MYVKSSSDSAGPLILAVVLTTTLSHAETKIGAIFDLTGDLNIYGIQQNNALNLAVESVNAAGGVNGRTSHNCWL